MFGSLAGELFDVPIAGPCRWWTFCRCLHQRRWKIVSEQPAAQPPDGVLGSPESVVEEDLLSPGTAHSRRSTASSTYAHGRLKRPRFDAADPGRTKHRSGQSDSKGRVSHLVGPSPLTMVANRRRLHTQRRTRPPRNHFLDRKPLRPISPSVRHSTAKDVGREAPAISAPPRPANRDGSGQRRAAQAPGDRPYLLSAGAPVR
jgi:hypothetical protein